MDIACAGKRHGHNFVGGVCLNGCGADQRSMSRMPKAPQRIVFDRVMPKPSHGMHSPEHALAKDISEWAGEPRSFARYLGIIKRIGINASFVIFSKLRDAERRGDIKNRGALFMWHAKTDKKESGRA